MKLKIPDVRQKTDSDCGPACVRAVCRFWRDKPPRDLNRELLHTDDGTDLTAIEIWLRRRRYAVLSGSMTVDDLRHQTRTGRPVIVPITEDGVGHFVVVSGVARGGVWLHDPNRGLRRIRVEDWLPLWFGVSKSVRYDLWGVSIWPDWI